MAGRKKAALFEASIERLVIQVRQWLERSSADSNEHFPRRVHEPYLVSAALAAFLAMSIADPARADENGDSSLRLTSEESVSEAERLYRRYRKTNAAGFFLLSCGVGFAIPAIGYGVAWSRTEEEKGDPPGEPMMPPSFSFRLSQRQKYKTTTIAFASMSFVLITGGTAIVVNVQPKLKRTKKQLGESPRSASRHPVLMLEPFVYSEGGGGQLRISF